MDQANNYLAVLLLPRSAGSGVTCNNVETRFETAGVHGRFLLLYSQTLFSRILGITHRIRVFKREVPWIFLVRTGSDGSQFLSQLAGALGARNVRKRPLSKRIPSRVLHPRLLCGVASSAGRRT